MLDAGWSEHLASSMKRTTFENRKWTHCFRMNGAEARDLSRASAFLHLPKLV